MDIVNFQLPTVFFAIKHIACLFGRGLNNNTGRVVDFSAGGLSVTGRSDTFAQGAVELTQSAVADWRIAL